MESPTHEWNFFIVKGLVNKRAIILNGDILFQDFKEFSHNKHLIYTHIYGGEKGSIFFVEKPNSISNLPKHLFRLENEWKYREANPN
jgi:hypothetical protein